MSNLLEALISASERAANIARACCNGSSEDGALLIAEKCAGEANARFDHDFKTIADVLAQEAAKTEIGARLPEISEHVRGEECGEIGGVQILLKKTIEETTRLLAEIVPEVAARRMAEAAHTANLSVLDDVPKDLPNLNIEDIGVWIDPIDSTSEFISGAKGEAAEGQGLQCVTVLIGAYLRSTGEPVAGVINQPFYNDGQGRIIWGLCYDNTKVWSNNVSESTNSQVVLMSSADNPEICDKLKSDGWEVQSVPGAGNKLMKVALDEAKMYLVSRGTTFRWDTCAPHAILRAKGGNIVNFTTREPLTYNDPVNLDTQCYCNSGGLIAYNDRSILTKLQDLF